MVTIEKITFRHGERALLEEASARIPARARVGLVGRNGAGKSTLLALIAGRLEAETGTIQHPRRWRVASVAQEAPGGASTPLETVLAADAERARLLVAAQTEAQSAADAEHLAETHERLNALGAHAAPARAAAILAGLGFDEAAQARPLNTFSGGWRMRVALAAVLHLEPDLLLLDEPTNHLDLEATLWLTGYLSRYAGAVIVASHDRALLDAVTTHTLFLSGRRLRLYTGNFARFEQTRRSQSVHEARAVERQIAQRRHMQEFVDRFRYKATKARQAQSRLKAIAKLPPPAPIIIDHPAVLDFPPVQALPPPLLTFERVALGYDGAPVLRGLDLRIDPDDRIALLGRNGNGKTTLARAMAGTLAPMEGSIVRARKLVAGYFAQDQAEALAPEETPFALASRLLGGPAQARTRAYLGRFGFGVALADNPVRTLSGGEKARLALALMAVKAPQILILDEPTNHLDVDTRDALVQALNAHEGAVVLISHDAHLIETVADRLWLVADGGCRPFDGDMADYRTLIQRQRKERSAGSNQSTQRATGARPNPARRTSAGPGERTQARRAVRAAEARLEQLGHAFKRVEAALTDPATYAGRPERIGELERARRRLAQEIAGAEAAWLAAQETLDATG